MKEQLLNLFQTVFEDEVDENTAQSNCSEWDSLKHLTLIVEVETTFGLSLEPEEIGSMQSFNDLLKLLEQKQVS